jgi:hypothetical protein
MLPSLCLNESHLASVVMCGWVWLSIVCVLALQLVIIIRSHQTLLHAGELFIHT